MWAALVRNSAATSTLCHSIRVPEIHLTTPNKCNVRPQCNNSKRLHPTMTTSRGISYYNLLFLLGFRFSAGFFVCVSIFFFHSSPLPIHTISSSSSLCCVAQFFMWIGRHHTALGVHSKMMVMMMMMVSLSLISPPRSSHYVIVVGVAWFFFRSFHGLLVLPSINGAQL